MNIKRIFAGLALVALALGFVAAAPAHAADKIRIISGELCVTDTVSGSVRYDGKAWALDEEGWKKKCAALANAGTNAIRILPYGVWDPRPYGKRSQFCPWILEGNAWDLSKFNAYYFPIVRRIVEIVNAYGMEAWFAWFDYCQLQPGTWTAMSPWKHNIQSVTSFYDKTADPYSKAWVRRLVKELNGTRVFWPWGNELGGAQFPEWARRVIFPLIRELAIPFDRMTYGAVMGKAPYIGSGKFGDAFTGQDTARKYFGEDFPPESNKYKVIREVHTCGAPSIDTFTPYGLNPAQAACWWGNKPVGLFVLSDDGVKDNWPSVDGGRPDAKKWKAMATWALGFKNLGGLEHLSEGGTLEYQAGVVAAIGAAYHAKFGSWPENTGKWHYEPPPPPAEYVEVTICRASGLIANPYCPDPYVQKYVKGTEPTAICGIHTAPPPPPPPQDCSCKNWLNTDGGRKADYWRYFLCVFGGAKRCI